MSFPYTYYRCPCADATIESSSEELDEEVEQENSFHPHAPRASFSLYPLEHLLWCEDCHEIRCPRCVIEEVVCWYCPSCLFEVPSLSVRQDGNRCNRNCFSCPLCTAPLSVTSLNTQTDSVAGPWILMCEYCHWNTLEIGVQFERPSNIQSQLARILSGKQGSAQTKRTTEIELESVSGSGDQLLPSRTDPELQFQAIVSYYKAELEKERPNDPLLSASSGVNFNSPSSLQRIVALYMNQGTSGKKTSTKPMFMRGSVDAGEGLVPINAATEEAAIDKLRGLGLDGTTTAEQRVNQVHNPRFLDELRPLPVLLRTKRSRRCRTCRHILVRPEQKISNPRYRIKLVAFNNIPTMNIKPLATSTDLAFDFTAMPHSRPLQLLLTLRNPLFDKVKVTLGTPTQTSGRLSSRVTILCPQFEIGANTDVWDEALGDGKRSSRLMTKGIKSEDAGEGKVAEAGKIWERGRNWTTVVMEIVCARIECPDDELKEDEDVLEIPIFVRLEYEADAAGRAAQAEKEKQEKRDLAYWTVLGVGKIARSPNITTKAP